MAFKRFNVLKDISHTFTCQVLGFLFGIGSSILLNRLLGPEGKGRFVAIIVVPQLIVAFTHMGYGVSSSYFIGKKKYSSGDVFKSDLLLSIIIGSVGALAGYFLYLKLFPEEPTFYRLTPLLLVFTGLWFYYFPDILLGKGKLFTQNLWNLAKHIMKFALIFLFLTIFINKLEGAISAVLLVNGILFISSFFVLSKVINLKGRVNSSYLKDGFSFGHKVFFAELLGFLNYRFDIILLKLFSTSSQIGFYSTATFMAETLWLLPGAVSLVLYTKLVTGEKTEEVTPGVLKNTFLLIVFAALVLLFIARPLIRIFYTDAFLPAFLPFAILLPGVVLLAIPKVLASHFIGVWGKPELIMKGRIASVVTNVVLSIVLIPRYGMYGAAFGSTLAYMIESIFILSIFNNRKKLVRI